MKPIATPRCIWTEHHPKYWVAGSYFFCVGAQYLFSYCGWCLPKFSDLERLTCGIFYHFCDQYSGGYLIFTIKNYDKVFRRLFSRLHSYKRPYGVGRKLQLYSCKAVDHNEYVNRREGRSTQNWVKIILFITVLLLAPNEINIC